MSTLKIGVLAFHGDVIEHIRATRSAAKHLKINVEILEIRTKNDIPQLSGLIIPGGESTTMHKLCVREHMWGDMKRIPAIFGTCAGAIMIAQSIQHKIEGQESLERIDIDIDRNAYGRQTDSFEAHIHTTLGDVNAVFIRAPKIRSSGNNVRILAEMDGGIIACEENREKTYAMAACFHPELTSTVFHEHFLKTVRSMM